MGVDEPMPAYRDETSRTDRLKGWALVVGVYALGALAWWLAPKPAPDPDAADPPTVMVDIEEPPAPPVIDQPKPKAAPAKEEGAAGKKANPSPVVAPEPRIPAPSPLAAAPTAGTGDATTAGAADRGNGPGAGGTGNGRGGGGGVSAPRYLSGGLKDSDYPRSLVDSGISGNVSIRFTVLTSGRIANCRIARSSGSRELDALTCRLLTERLRFVPAKDANGRAVPFELGNDYGWGIRRR
jgi:protein TonB